MMDSFGRTHDLNGERRIGWGHGVMPPHTPGPWFVSGDGSAFTLVRAGNAETGKRIATTWASTSQAKSNEAYLNSIRVNEANARLIAAAPDLADAAANLLSIWDASKASAPVREAVATLRAALTRAGGA